MYEYVEKSSNFTFIETDKVEPNIRLKKKEARDQKPRAICLLVMQDVCSAGQHMCLNVRSSEGLVLSPGVMQVVLMVRVVEVVGLVAMVAVADDGVLDAFALQVLLLVDALQLPQQLLDEGLGRSAGKPVIVRLSHVSHEHPSSLCACWRTRACLRHCPLQDFSGMFCSD